MPKPSPMLNIPSGHTVTVRIINTSNIGGIPVSNLMGPPVPGVTTCSDMPSFSFLLEHRSGRKLLFDLGVRKDWWNQAPSIVKQLEVKAYDIQVEKNVIEVLEQEGIKGEQIEGVIWSHWHWDHVGDPSTFPPSTDLIVGPGFKKAFVPGAPTNQDAPILESDYAGRNLREIDFTDPSAFKVGRLRALDFWGDGSFYLLDTPGHAIGHLCGLARTTTSPDPDTADTFIFLGGDVCHHCGEFRPSQYLPLPSSVASRASEKPSLTSLTPNVPFCPGSGFEELQREREMDPQGPLFVPTMGHDIPEAIRTIGKVQEADADENVFVIMAHDPTVRDAVDLFPKSVNSWKEKGWATNVKWAFLRDLEPYFKIQGVL